MADTSHMTSITHGSHTAHTQLPQDSHTQLTSQPHHMPHLTCPCLGVSAPLECAHAIILVCVHFVRCESCDFNHVIIDSTLLLVSCDEGLMSWLGVSATHLLALINFAIGI